VRAALALLKTYLTVVDESDAGRRERQHRCRLRATNKISPGISLIARCGGGPATGRSAGKSRAPQYVNPLADQPVPRD
jgi:hypothetical protein